MIEPGFIRSLNMRQYLSIVLRHPCQGSNTPGIIFEVTQHSHFRILIGKGFTVLLNIFFCTNNLHSANVFALNKLYPGNTLSICLTKNEIKELTLKVHYAAQARTLSEMGICYTLRPDGSPVVLNSTLKGIMAMSIQKPHLPDFSSLDH